MGYPLLRNPKILLSPPRERIKVRGANLDIHPHHRLQWHRHLACED
jgi:hypothetical protein